MPASADLMSMSRSRTLVLAIVMSGMFACAPSWGQSFCSEPVEPYCVSTDSEFDTLLQVNRCVDDLKEYEQEVNDYEKCISTQIGKLREGISQARHKLEESRKEF